MRRLRNGLAGLLLTLAATPSIARAEFGLVPDSFTVSTLDAADQPELRAGAHPDRLITGFAFNTLPDTSADGNVKDIVIDLPSGLVGDANAVPTCSRTAFAQNGCGAESQVGMMRATFAGLGSLEFPLYNVTANEDEVAEFGFFALLFPVRLVVSVRADGGYGTQIELRELAQNAPLIAGEVELWGVPADHQSGTTIERKPLLTNPTSCDGSPLRTGLRVRSWQRPDEWIGAVAAASGSLTGCDALPFQPSFSLGLDASTADTPSGVSVELVLPHDNSPDGRATSHVRAFSTTLPGGLTLSPGLADGLSTCSDDQFGIGSAGAPACPSSSRIGSLELRTPLFAEAIDGAIFFGRPTAAEPYRVLVSGTRRSLMLKLAGSLRPDAETGRLSLELSGLPPIPFSHMALRFKGGPRAPLATPIRCGAGAATASVNAYRGGAPAALANTIEISGGPDGRPCARVAPFAPQFVAGSTRPLAGRSSTFSMTATRADGQQTLSRLSMTLPAGLSARLADVARCPIAQAVRASCARTSRVGAVAIEAGAGASPLPFTGDAYLTGPHAGAPFGLALVLRAQAGPLDLGTVVVLTSLRLDPADARVTITTDPLPTIVGGIPLRMRTLALDVDRPGFMLHPTSCEPTRIDATFTSLDAATSTSAARYAVGGCRRLRFAPTIAMSLGSRRELRRDGRPKLRIVLRSKAGLASLRSVSLRLPSMLALDAAAVSQVCTRKRAREGNCPSAATVGSARVRTPLLPRTLTGSVHVVQPSRGIQPELWATVAGMGVRLRLRSTMSAPDGKPITTRFVDLPDIPISSFALTLRGGDGGALTLTRGLCAGGAARRVVAGALLRGHNDALRSTRVRVDVHPSC